MKTTLDLADPLFHAANALAAQQGTTLSALVEEGLRLVMDRRKNATTLPYKYQDFSVKGQALVSDPAKWQDLEMHWALERLERSEQNLRAGIADKKAQLDQQKTAAK